MRELTDQIVTDLFDGLSVLLVGLPQSGRSHEAAAVTRRLTQRRANVVTLKGNRQLSDRPLAVLSLQVTTGDEGQGGSGLSRAVASLEALMKGPNSVLVIDDADAFDAVTVGVIAEARREASWPMLLVGGLGRRTEEALAGLVQAAQPGIQITMTGMPLEDVSHMANQLVDGVVSAFTVSRIATLSGGLPGLVRAVVQTGLRSGRLVLQDGVWVAPGTLWDDALGFALRPFVQGLEPDELDRLAELASVPGLAHGGADHEMADAATKRLWQRGLLRPDALGIQVFPPALGEWLAQSAGRGRSDWPGSMGAADAVMVSSRIRGHWRDQVERHWAAWRDDMTFENAVPLLVGLFCGAADDERIPTVFSQTTRGAGDDRTTFVLLQAAHMALWRRDLPAAVHQLSELGRSQPTLVTYLRGIECLLTVGCERVPGEAAMTSGDDAHPRATEMMALARAESHIAKGSVNDAVACLEQVGRHDRDLAFVASPLRGLAELLGGNLETGTHNAMKQLGESLSDMDRLSISGHAYVAGLGLFLLGRFDEFASVAQIVHRLGGTDVFQSNYKVGLLQLGSFVAHLEGRADDARVLAIQAQSVGAGAGPLPGMTSRPHILLDPSVTAEEIWDEVDDLLDRGFLLGAVFLAALTVERCTPSPRAVRLIEVGSSCQGSVLRTLTRLVATVDAGELGDYPSAIEELRECGGPLFTTSALITWALKLRESGDVDGWLRQVDVAWHESRRMGCRFDGLFDRLAAAVGLTLREAEVARLTVDGLSSSEAAKAIGVSPRTVEAYVQSVYRKTGVNSRDALQQISRTWLRLPSE